MSKVAHVLNKEVVVHSNKPHLPCKDCAIGPHKHSRYKNYSSALLKHQSYLGWYPANHSAAAGPQITLFRYNSDGMPWELNSCSYQLT